VPQTAKLSGHFIQFLGYSPFLFDTSTLGGRIRNFRFESGLSHEDLARKIGINESAIYAWEKEENKPMRRKLSLLQKIMNV